MMIYSRKTCGNTFDNVCTQTPRHFASGRSKLSGLTQGASLGDSLYARKGHIMSIAQISSDPITNLVNDCVRGYLAKDTTTDEVRVLATYINKVNILGFGDLLLSQTVELASNPETDDEKNLRTFIKAVMYRLLVEEGAYAPSGEFYVDPKSGKDKKARPARHLSVVAAAPTGATVPTKPSTESKTRAKVAPVVMAPRVALAAEKHLAPVVLNKRIEALALRLTPEALGQIAEGDCELIATPVALPHSDAHRNKVFIALTRAFGVVQKLERAAKPVADKTTVISPTIPATSQPRHGKNGWGVEHHKMTPAQQAQSDAALATKDHLRVSTTNPKSAKAESADKGKRKGDNQSSVATK